MITVVITPSDVEEAIGSEPPPARRRYVGEDRVYRLYACDRPNITITDPVTNEQLAACQRFDTEADALDWIGEDDRQRRLLHVAKVRS